MPDHVYTVVFYKQYGRWSVTVPFDTKSEARRHVELYLDRPEKDYVTDITYHDVILPKGRSSNAR